jgi:hypothetical protein
MLLSPSADLRQRRQEGEGAVSEPEDGAEDNPTGVTVSPYAQGL